LVLKILLFNAFEESDRDVCQFISYGARLLSGKQAKFSNVFHRLSRNLNENGDTNLNWVNHIREYVLSFYQRDLAGFSPIIYIILPFPILRTSYIALSALSARCFLVTSKLHVFVKITPK
jgi:hypothetical protein